MRVRKPRLIDAAILEQAQGYIRRARREQICKAKKGNSVAFLAAVYNLIAMSELKSYDQFVASMQFLDFTKP